MARWLVKCETLLHEDACRMRSRSGQKLKVAVTFQISTWIGEITVCIVSAAWALLKPYRWKIAPRLAAKEMGNPSNIAYFPSRRLHCTPPSLHHRNLSI